MTGADEERLLCALELLEILEWSGVESFNENMHSAPTYATVNGWCPICHGFEEARRDVPEPAWGHRESCKLRRVLGRPASTVTNVAMAERIRLEREHAELMATQREGPWKEFHAEKFRKETEG
jgi:hypothetical protein